MVAVSTEDVEQQVELVPVFRDEIVQVQEIRETKKEVGPLTVPEEVEILFEFESPSFVKSPSIEETKEALPVVTTVSGPITSASTTVDTSEFTDNKVSPADLEMPTSKPATKNQVYEIVAGQVRKVSPDKSRPSTPKIQTEVANTSNNTTPLLSTAQSTAFHRFVDHHPRPRRGSLGRIRYGMSPDGRPARQWRETPTPKEAEVFVECGDMADKSAVGVLVRSNAPWPGSPFHRHPHGQPTRLGSPPADVIVGPTLNDSGDHSVLEHSQFGYGMTTPINQCSVRSGVFDPLENETPKHVSALRDKKRPLLQDLNHTQLKALLDRPPNCFCEKLCTRFDGVVPVYVCGAFGRRPQRLYFLSFMTKINFKFHFDKRNIWMCLPYARSILGMSSGYILLDRPG